MVWHDSFVCDESFNMFVYLYMSDACMRGLVYKIVWQNHSIRHELAHSYCVPRIIHKWRLIKYVSYTYTHSLSLLLSFLLSLAVSPSLPLSLSPSHTHVYEWCMHPKFRWQDGLKKTLNHSRTQWVLTCDNTHPCVIWCIEYFGVFAHEWCYGAGTLSRIEYCGLFWRI